MNFELMGHLLVSIVSEFMFVGSAVVRQLLVIPTLTALQEWIGLKLFSTQLESNVRASSHLMLKIF